MLQVEGAELGVTVLASGPGEGVAGSLVFSLTHGSPAAEWYPKASRE